MDKNDILDKIRKIQALANQGVGGEKESAERRLREMMEKYNITEADLSDEHEEIWFLRVEGRDCKMVFNQVANVYCGVSRMRYFGADDQTVAARTIRDYARMKGYKRENMSVVCTLAQFLEVKVVYEVFQESFNKQYEAFVYAFLAKNNLLGKGDPDHEVTPEEEEMAMNAYMMMDGIKKTNVQKRLSGGDVLPEHC